MHVPVSLCVYICLSACVCVYVLCLFECVCVCMCVMVGPNCPWTSIHLYLSLSVSLYVCLYLSVSIVENKPLLVRAPYVVHVALLRAMTSFVNQAEVQTVGCQALGALARYSRTGWPIYT
jgi:hypothetical protein